MNGRIYDPLLGRFLSADILVQAPGNLQSYNRYSYVFNNPLSYTDPSGFAAAEDEKKAALERFCKRVEARALGTSGPSGIAGNMASVGADQAQSVPTPNVSNSESAGIIPDASASIRSGTPVAQQAGTPADPKEKKPEEKAPNRVNAANATSVNGVAETGVSLADGSILFQKGKSYLVVYSGKEQGATNASDIASFQKNAGVFGYKLIALNLDGRQPSASWSDYVKGAVGSSTFDGIFFDQHGGVSGSVNRTVAGLFQNDLAPALGGYLNSGGYVTLMQCHGVFADGFVQSIKESFGGAPVYSAGGYNSMTYQGAVSYLPVNPSTDDGYFYSNRYSPWVKN
jgi:hypothetical protein